MPNQQRPPGELNLNKTVARVTKDVISTSDKTNAMFDCDSQPVSNNLKGAAIGRERLVGTSDSPKSTNLMDDQVDEDYRNELKWDMGGIEYEQ